MRREVAEAAVAAGARIVNDVSGGLADPRMLDVGRRHGATYVAMHWRAHSDRHAATTRRTTGRAASSRPCATSWRERVEAMLAAGIAATGSCSTRARLRQDRRAQLGAARGASTRSPTSASRVLVGASRKSFLGALLAGGTAGPRPVDDREHAHVALAMLLAQQRGLGAPGARRARQPATRCASWPAATGDGVRTSPPSRLAEPIDEPRMS